MPKKTLQVLDINAKFVDKREALQAMAREWRHQGKRIVFTNGCFDILHSGHVACLNQARAYGDVLIVGLNSDASVRRLKGHERPVNTLKDRAQVLCGLEAVDIVTPFSGNTPQSLIITIRPDVYIKGGDYTPESLPEAKIVARFGGEVVIVPLLANHSTTGTIARLRQTTKP